MGRAEMQQLAVIGAQRNRQDFREMNSTNGIAHQNTTSGRGIQIVLGFALLRRLRRTEQRRQQPGKEAHTPGDKHQQKQKPQQSSKKGHS